MRTDPDAPVPAGWPGELGALGAFLAHDPPALGWFAFAYHTDGPALTRLNAHGANLRARWLDVPFGDQDFVLYTADFLVLGGFDEAASYGEDHRFVWTARAAGRPVGGAVATSARRYARLGWARMMLMHGASRSSRPGATCTAGRGRQEHGRRLAPATHSRKGCHLMGGLRRIGMESTGIAMPMRIIFALLLVLSSAGRTLAAPRADLWTRWQAHDDASTQTVDTRAWAAFLKSYLRPGADGINRVAYGAVTPADRAALDADLQRLQRVPVSTLSRDEQRAYWTNLYNELTVQVVLQYYPVSSITKISLTPGLFSGGGPWDRKLIRVEDEPISLNDIEHRILRPIWQDPRTHYTLNCASLGCPNLQPVPYGRANMETLLSQAASDYVNSPRGFTVRDGRLTASSIYAWYQADFGGTDQGVIEHLRRFARPEKRQTLQGVTSVARDTYDWALNDAPAP